ncbi:signal peptidase I [Nanoarchaeota archaeon]
MDKKQIKKTLKKIWDFIWHSNSIWSWIVNIILAFIIIKFLVYPGLGLVLGTSHPIVAVVSESMEHDGNFDQWWAEQQDWYQEHNITKEEFQGFSYRNGFNKGDIMILVKKNPTKTEVGDILVFDSQQANPIIHRIVKKWQVNDQWHFQTKGDHNRDSIGLSSVNEEDINEDRIIGQATLKVPLLGWIKIIFVDYIVQPIANIFR